MRVKLLAYTQNADAICAAAGRSCYSEKSSMELVDSMKDPQKTLGKIVGMGHHSVIEHATFTFSVEGVSRSLKLQSDTNKERNLIDMVASQRLSQFRLVGVVYFLSELPCQHYII